MIKCLPREVQEELRSSVAVPSLQQCVEELVLNSIDAGATCVGVRMDLEAFKVQVIDNGVGMGAEDMDRIGNRYHTSKCSTVDDLDQLRFYGFRGEAVASLVSLASLVEITSKTRTSANTLVKVFKHGNGSDVFQSDTDRPSAGTTVVICNFFHNLPVRRKRTDPVLEGERIRHRLEAVSLMQTSVSFTLKNDATGTMMVQLPKARDMYHRFIQIHGLARAQKLGEVRHSRAQFEVVGFLGREGHYNSSLQYLYINGRFLLKTRIHLLLNQLLRQLGNSKHNSPEKPTATRSPRQKRGQELHAVYVVNITCPHSEYDVCLEPAKTLVEFKDWDGVLLCVEEAVKSFLVRENLEVAVQDDSDDCDPAAAAEEDTGLNGDEASPDCSSWITLASENVYRKFKSETCEQTEREKTTSGPEQASDGELGNAPEVEDEDDEEHELQSDAVEHDSKDEEEETEHKTMRLLSAHRFDSLQALATECRSVSKGKRSGKDLQGDAAPKIPRFERISLSNQFGSLDTFRRLYGKAEKPTKSSQSLLSQKDLSGSGKVLKSPTSLAAVSQFKPNPGLSGPKPSLAAKLNQLKQNTGPKAVQNDGTAQDANNNKGGSEPIRGEDLDSVAEGSGDWLRHYSACAGRTVYVNKRTGLSRYQEPKENRVHCASDVTNMAVSVVSEEGEHRCYPFQGDLVLPFLPKSRLDRVLSAGTGDRGEGSVSSSLSSMYSKWKNPVFVRPPEVGVDISSVHTERLKVKIHNILFPYRFTKDMIPSIKVIDQVDRKFLACLINTTEEAADEGNLLVLLDQHAAHERVRLEALVAESYEDATGGRRLSSSNIVPPLEVHVPDEELRLLRSCEDQLSSLGLELTFPLTSDSPLLVHSVPLCFLERERNEVRRRRASVIKPLVEELLREQTELLRESGRVRGTLPLTVLNVLASLACHGAIKFNDQLSRNESSSLVASLSSCQLPFQCAHGRPSIAPLVDFLHVDLQPESLKPNLHKLTRMYKSWQLHGNT
ncbi:DNA mismatch repair protein Mlh3 [Neosynchiropus ocellatus]